MTGALRPIHSPRLYALPGAVEGTVGGNGIGAGVYILDSGKALGIETQVGVFHHPGTRRAGDVFRHSREIADRQQFFE